ncbi:MAG: HlyD family secretion protein [Saprospiraceae bacterium]
MEEYNNIELRSEEVQEILGEPPGWIERFGTSAVIVVLVTITAVSYFFKYPDKILAPIVVVTEMPPTRIITEVNGEIAKLNVSEGDRVEKGKVLAVIENTTKYDDVKALDSLVIRLKRMSASELVAFRLPYEDWELGTIQSDYSNFRRAFTDYTFQQAEGYDQQRLSQIKSKMRIAEQNIAAENRKKREEKSRLRAKNEQVRYHQDMFADGIISRQTLENKIEERDAIEREIETIDGTIRGFDLEMEGHRGDIAEVRSTNRSDDTKQFTALQESINQLQTSISQWKRAFILRANQDGTATFFNNIWSEGQYVKAGDALLAIVPDEGVEQSNELIGRVALPVVGSGKVDTLQRVIIKFSSYPFQEYGAVVGQVVKKSRVPKDNVIAVEVSVPQNLKTSRGIELDFEQQMQGTAEIITEDKRLFERIFEKLIEVFGIQI